MRDQPTIESVNRLVKRSFGPLHRGDYVIVGGTSPMGAALLKRPALHVIATDFTFIDPQFGGGIKGKFLLADGSALAVIRKYEARARKYARLYLERFGRVVHIELHDDFYALDV